MKNDVKHGHSSRHGNKPAPYTKYEKKPQTYKVDRSVRLANGELKNKANDRTQNKYL